MSETVDEANLREENQRLFLENIQLLYRFREKIFSNPKYYYIHNPFLSLGYKRGCNHIGKLLNVWDKHPIVRGIFSCGGSPCTGASSFSRYNFEKGKVEHKRNEISFGELTDYFGDKEFTPLDVVPLSLKDLIENLKKEVM